MKVNTPYFILEFEWLLIIVIFITILSPTIQGLIAPFFICYLFILFHELAHIFVASIVGKNMDTLKLSLSGVCVSFDKPRYISSSTKKLSKCLTDLFIYLAGPISNIVFALIFRHNQMIFEVNMSLAILNLIPIYPLDGFNILNNLLLIQKIDKSKSEMICNIVSNIVLIGFSLFAILVTIITLNPSVLIFIVYLFILKRQRCNENRVFSYIKDIEC